VSHDVLGVAAIAEHPQLDVEHVTPVLTPGRREPGVGTGAVGGSVADDVVHDHG
jgi:hypothetical protein